MYLLNSNFILVVPKESGRIVDDWFPRVVIRRSISTPSINLRGEFCRIHTNPRVLRQILCCCHSFPLHPINEGQLVQHIVYPARPSQNQRHCDVCRRPGSLGDDVLRRIEPTMIPSRSAFLSSRSRLGHESHISHWERYMNEVLQPLLLVLWDW